MSVFLEMRILPIQFFAEGGSTGTGAEGEANSGVTPGDAASESGEPEIIYGFSEDPVAGDQKEQEKSEQPEQKTADEEFGELIAKDGKYKTAFDARVQEILRARLRENDAQKAEAERQKKKITKNTQMKKELERR